jgi:hypothetical protein
MLVCQPIDHTYGATILSIDRPYRDRIDAARSHLLDLGAPEAHEPSIGVERP